MDFELFINTKILDTPKASFQERIHKKTMCKTGIYSAFSGLAHAYRLSTHMPLPRTRLFHHLLYTRISLEKIDYNADNSCP